MAVQVFCPAAVAVGEVLAVGDQALVQVAGEQRDAVGARVVPEELTGHADLTAAAGAEHRLIEPGPVLDRINAGGFPPDPLHPRKGSAIHGAQIAVACVLRCLIPGPNFLCSLPHPLVCGPLSHADLQVQTHADLECLLHLCSMRHADREISCCSCSARMQDQKEDFKSAASTIPPCPRSHRNAFRGFVAAKACPIGADLATLKPPSADR